MVRKEIIRFSHVRTEELDGVGLKDFNLSVFTGELIYLTGIHGSGKHSVRGVVEAKQRLTGGCLYIDEEPVGLMDKRMFRNRGIFVIDGSKSLSGNLSISENFFLLRPHKSGKFLYREKFAVSETGEILKEYGIGFDPMEKMQSLNQCSQYLLSIAKAVSTGARLLVVDCLELSVNLQEFKKLAEVFQSLKERGISTIVIDNVVNPLLEAADRAVVVYDGRDLKVVDGERLTMEEMAGYLAEAPLGEERQESQKEHRARHQNGRGEEKWGEPKAGCRTDRRTKWSAGRYGELSWFGQAVVRVPEGSLIGLHDMGRDTRIPFEHYVKDLTLENGFSWNGIPFLKLNPAYIPENGGNLLLENMTPGDNLLLPSYKRISGLLGYIPRGVMEYAALGFQKELGRETAAIAELSRAERKILCIRRWILGKAGAIFMENPDMGLDLEGQKRIFEILREAAAGIPVFVTSHNPFTLRMNCSVILQLDNGNLKETIWPEKSQE